jgi:hypothetical protein
MMLRALLLGTVLLAGCNNNKELIDQAQEFETRACACKDAACEDVVVKDVKTWFDTYKNRRGTQDDVNAVERHFTKMGECMAKTGLSDASAKMLMDIATEAEKL